MLPALTIILKHNDGNKENELTFQQDEARAHLPVPANLNEIFPGRWISSGRSTRKSSNLYPLVFLWNHLKTTSNETQPVPLGDLRPRLLINASTLHLKSFKTCVILYNCMNIWNRHLKLKDRSQNLYFIILPSQGQKHKIKPNLLHVNLLLIIKCLFYISAALWSKYKGGIWRSDGNIDWKAIASNA